VNSLQKPAGWFARNRGKLYPLFNAGMFLAVLGGMMVHGAEPGVVVYVLALIALCSTPLIFLRHWNDRYALFAVFMAMYFLFFGALDLSTIVLGSDLPPVARPAFITPAERAILLGALLVVVGYLAGVRLGARNGPAAAPAEWSTGMLLVLGLFMYLAGTVSILYFQVFAAPDKSNMAMQGAFQAMGPLLTFAVMLGHMLQPLGILILAYGYAKRGGTFWLALILMVVVTGVFVGFVTDVKRIALMGAALVVMTRVLVDNKLPRTWIICSIIGISLLFPIFQAYRSAVEGDRGLDRAHAIQELGKVLEIALTASNKETREVAGERPQSFIERSSLKWSLESVFEHVGVDVPYLEGRSLVALPMAFVPRLLAPDKADVSVGQLFTHMIAHADTDTYISISHLGELYWNFGWLGVLGGMSITGLLLGFVGGRYNLEGGTSVTRILVLLVTTQSICIGFEGTVPVAYSLWLRSMAAIGLLHLLCARSVSSSVAAPQVVQPKAQAGPRGRGDLLLPAPVRAPRFPNMMS
jgi:hypothetical protein